MDEISLHTKNLPTDIWLGIFLFISLCFGILFVLNKRNLLIVQWMSIVLLSSYYFVVLCSTVIYRSRIESVDFNFTPFWSYSAIINNEPSITKLEVILNIILFVPIGLLLGIFRNTDNERKLKKSNLYYFMIFFIGIVLSLSIEISQFVFHKGFSETDDVIHNTLGCVIGYFLIDRLILFSESIR